MTEDTEFGYKATARTTRPAPRPVYYVCSSCGEDNVEAKWYCSWNVEKQAWEPCDRVEYEDYCNDCGDSMDVEERNYGD